MLISEARIKGGWHRVVESDRTSSLARVLRYGGNRLDCAAAAGGEEADDS